MAANCCETAVPLVKTMGATARREGLPCMYEFTCCQRLSFCDLARLSC